MSVQLLKREQPADVTVVEPLDDADERDVFAGIRCPLCEWRPSPSSRWCCLWVDTPEPPFRSCGTVWNTFATHGRCPGCGHQWTWTSCLQCAGWSLHVDWYEEASERPGGRGVDR